MADRHRAGPVLQITDLQTEIRLRNATVHAVDGVSLTVAAGECLGLVGESGSGKTMTARSVLRLLPAGGVITGGSVVLNGTELTNLSERSMEAVRGNDVGMVFQDPSSCLDPTMTIGRQIAESVIVHKGANRQAAAARAVEMLRLVRMPEPERVTSLHPHQLSGGMRQRAMIAAALACEPSLLIADEPTTALDVTIQREILELIDDLRAQLGMAVILVTHDLGVIAGRTERVAVMYGGRIIEQATTSALLAGPRHPYTEALFDALPEMAGPASRSLYSIPGRPPDLTAHTSGCAFAPRCRYAQDWCTSREPGLDGDHPGHTYACFFPIGVTAAAGAGAAGPDGWAGAGGGAVAGGTAGATFGADGRQPVSAWAGRWAGGSASGGAASGGAVPGFSTAGGHTSGHAAAGRAGSAPDGAAEPLLRVAGLVKDFEVRRGMLGRPTGAVSAVAGVSFDLAAGQTFGLVGESGCGKTSIARLLVGLERATAGSIVLSGTELATLSPRQLRRHRPGVQLMFQDAFASLDPRMRVGSILREPLAIQKAVRRRGHRRQVTRILDEVGLPADAAGRYPREFSGGQRQRLALARALIQRPALIVADEPVSALDVSVQAQILNLMRKLQRQYGLSYLFISHDLSVIRYMADTIGVMYFGKLVEVGPAEEVCTAPAHPYTAGLIAAIPVVTGQPGRPGQGPTGQGTTGQAHGSDAGPTARTTPPSGCRFRSRCALAQDICAEHEPPLRPRQAGGQLVACHFPLGPAAPEVSSGHTIPRIA
jgi:peptide/nickel transport system ATP-binding protein